MMDEIETSSTFEGETEEEGHNSLGLTQTPKGMNYNSRTSLQKRTKKIPVPERLTTKTKTKLDAIRDHIPRPEGNVPPTSMPTWSNMPLDTKIPRLPGSDVFIRYTRGQPGDSLYRPLRSFSTSDPRNNISNPYTALHDPNAKTFLNKPCVKSLLRKQGLVNEYDEVVCSQKDFNVFRASLACQYNQKLKEILQRQDKQVKAEREQLKRIKAYERTSEPDDDLNECLALLLGDSEYLEDYIDVHVNRKPITAPAPKSKPPNVVDWRKDYVYKRKPVN